MSCPAFCVPCCYCCFQCCPCTERCFSEKALYESRRRKTSLYVEYGGRRQSQTPEALDSSQWPTKDQRVPISQVFADPVDTSRFCQYGMDELTPVTQQPRILGSPGTRSPARKAKGRRQSQPDFPGTRMQKCMSSSPIMGRRVSQPVIRHGSQPPLGSLATSPAHTSDQLSPLDGGSPLHGPPGMRGRRRSVQMASLHEDFYSDSEDDCSSTLDEIDEEIRSRTDITASDYETSHTSEEEDDGTWDGSAATRPLLSLPDSLRRKTQLPERSSTIPQIVVTEPFEIGPNPTLQFSIYYDFKRRTLIVHLQKGFNFPLRQIDSDTCNPFVIVYLLPNRETDRETYESSVAQNTINPNFDEMFQFPRLKPDAARKQTLVFRIYHQVGPKHNILIGGVLQQLEGVDFHGKTLRNRIVEDVEDYQQDMQGRLLISLTSNPTKGTLEGTIFEANNLTKQDMFGLADPYVKVYLIYKGKRLSKWKTKVKKNTLVPVFNESFEFLIPGLNLRDLMVQVVVMDYDRFSRNDHVGIVDFGCDVSNDGGRNHWQEIVDSPREAISHWHAILPGKKGGGKYKEASMRTSSSVGSLPMCMGAQK